MSELLKVLSSQYKHLPSRPDAVVDAHVIKEISTLKNQPCHFQVLYRVKGDAFCHPVSIAFESELPLSVWRVDYVAVPCIANPHGEKGFESNLPGLFPDILMSRPLAPTITKCPLAWGNETYFEKDTDVLLNATKNDFQSLFVAVNENRDIVSPGIYPIKIKLISLYTGELLDQNVFNITVIDACAPENNIYYTNWFHVDCLCDTFNVSPYSNEFYEVFDEYVANMTRHRQNTLLLPAFTPPLDTPIGGERKNVQLVDIERKNREWHFSFDRMQRYIRHAKQGGIKYFEHCHLFSQWGAKGAPNIYLADGTRIFDICTDAQSEVYVTFIRAYLQAFLAFAKEEKIDNALLFHISDEPSLNHFDSYSKAYHSVADLLNGKTVADAMSDPFFYEKGVVDQPIASVIHADAFESKCPAFWLYYTGGSSEKNCANRLITNTAARTRVLGIQMYSYRAVGFLNWAYNFHYDRMSQGIYSPLSFVGGYKNYPGLSYLAYPITSGCGARVLPSLREKLMAEAFDDLSALTLLESLIGREKTLAICEEKLGKINTQTIPQGNDLYELREEINRQIAASF